MLHILIVDDQILFSEALKRALEGQGIAIVGTAASGYLAIEAIERECQDLALVDLRLPDISGFAVGRTILRHCPGTKLIALTAVKDPRFVKEALKVGFHGYLTKDSPIQRLVRVINSVLDGEVVVPQRLASDVSGARTPEEEAVELLAKQLTPRENEVLVLLVQGASGQEIARRLRISPNTVRTHVQSILMKLQVHSRLQAASFAVRHHLVPIGEQAPGRLSAAPRFADAAGDALS